MSEIERIIFYQNRRKRLCFEVFYVDDSTVHVFEYELLNGQWITFIDDLNLFIQKKVYGIIKIMESDSGKNIQTEEEFIDEWKKSHIIKAAEIIKKYRVKILLNELPTFPTTLYKRREL